MHEYGDPSVIRVEDVARPSPQPDEVLIEVVATSFNPTETALRSGRLRMMFPLALPYILGWDVAGVVVEVGEGVAGIAAGDWVIGRVDAGGAAAQYVSAVAETLVAAPTAIPLAEAAAIPVAGLAAWQAVFEHANLGPGERVLINGAGGGIGGFAVQFAKHAAAHVVATASPRSSATVRRHGADQLIDYTVAPLRDSLDGPVDVILNLTTLSPEQAAALVPLVRTGGRIVSAATPIEPAPDAAVTTKHMIARNDPQHLTAIVRLIDAGGLIVEAAESHPLVDLPLIHRRSEHGDTHGKIIVIP